MNTSKTQVELQLIFPTPVAIAALADAAELNPQLAETILAREKDQATTDHSNIGGWQSDWRFAEWGGAAGASLLAQGRALATRLTVDRAGKAVQPDWQVNAWANINRRGDSNEFHIHAGAFWSGVYYVDTGSDGGDEASSGGDLEFADPRGAAPAMYRPDLVPAFPGAAAMGAHEAVRPVAGMMIMFPSWVSHGVRPYRGTGTRISVAFNLCL